MSTAAPVNNHPEIPHLDPVLGPGHNYETVTEQISSAVLTRPTTLGWFAGFALAFSLLGMMTVAIGWLIIKGVGIWGINIPIGWGFAIVNFVWWIGIGHAGTLISAILFLLNQKWRTSINRFAEAMTLFAVACAGIFPLIHTGRPWMAYYMFPVSQHHGDMATIPQSADLGRFRGVHIRHGFIVVLVCGLDSRPGHFARSRGRGLEAENFWFAGHGLAWFRASLAPLPVGIFAAGRIGYAAGAFGAHGSEFRFLDRYRSGLAHYDFPALLRGWSNLFRICDGADDRYSAAQVLSL